MSTVTTNKFKSTTIYGTLNVIDNPNGNIISNTTLSGNLTVGGKINNIPVSTIAYVSNLTSDVQTQIDSKAPLASPTFTGTVSGITATMVGLGNVNDTTDLNKPVSTATQSALDLKAPLASPTFTGTVSGITATMVGLGNVNDTTDLNKPVSTATTTALNLKGGLSTDNTWSGTNEFNTSIPTTTLTPSLSSQFITKAYADSNYAGTGILSGSNTWTGTNTYNSYLPTSTIAPTSSTQFTNKSYVDLKAPLASPTFTGTVSGITKAMVGLSNVDDTSDLNKPVSTATTTALDLKSNLASPTFTGTLTTSLLTSTGLITTGGGISFNNETASNNVLTSIYKMVFDSNYGFEKIILYDSTSHIYNYSLGVLSNILFYQSPGSHNFYINGTSTTPILSIANTGATINGTCDINGTLSVNGVSISTTNGLTTPILKLSDYNLGTVYNGAIFQQNQNMTIRSWNSGTSEATNIYFTTMNTANDQSSTMILYNNAIHLNQPTTISGATTINGMLGLGGVSGRRLQVSESLGGITMYIEDSGNMYTAGTFASGNASVGTLECWGDITSREGIYIYSGKTLTANGPINAYSGLNVSSGATTLQNTTINGTTTLNTNLNLCSGTTSPTTGQLGQRITGTIYFSVTSSFTSVLSTITLTPGTWIIDGQVSFQSSGGSYYQINQYTVAFSKNSLINSTGMAQKSIYAGSGVVALVGFSNIQYGQLFSESLQQVVSHTADTNYSLLLLMQYNGGSNVMSNVNSYFYATRIA